MVGGIADIRKAPATPEEAMNEFPYAVCYPGSGAVAMGVYGPARMEITHTVVLEVHVARKDLPRDISAVRGFVDTIPNELFEDATLNSKAITISEIRYSFRTFEWGEGTNTIGYRFEIDVIQYTDVS